MAEQGLGAGGLLLRLAWRPALRGLGRSGWDERLRLGAYALGFLFFETLLHGLFRPVVRFLYRQEDLGPLLTSRVLALFFTLIAFFLILSSLLSLLSRVLQSEETALLAPTPVDEAAYFRFRAIQACLSSAGMLLPLWLPFAHALRGALDEGPAWELWAAAAPLPLAVLVFALSGLALRGLLALFDAARLRRGLGLLLLLCGLALVFWVRWQRPEGLADPERAGNAAAYLKALRNADLDALPSVWAAKAVMLAQERFAEALLWWLALAGSAVLAWWAMERAYARQVFALWQATQELGQRGAAPGPKGRLGLRWWRAPSAGQALAQKELAGLWRHPGQRLQAVILASLVALFAMNLARLPLDADSSLRGLLYLPVCAFAQLVVVAVAARFTYPGASLEARGAWLVAVSPRGLRAQLAARLGLHLPVLTLLAALLWLAVAQVFHPGPFQALVGALLFAASALASTCLALGLGTAWSKPTDGGPDDVVSSPSGVLALGLCFLFVVGQCALAALPLAEAYRLSYSRRFSANWLAFVVPTALWLGALAAATWLPLRLALKRIREGE